MTIDQSNEDVAYGDPVFTYQRDVVFAVDVYSRGSRVRRGFGKHLAIPLSSWREWRRGIRVGLSCLHCSDWITHTDRRNFDGASGPTKPDYDDEAARERVKCESILASYRVDGRDCWVHDFVFLRGDCWLGNGLRW